MLSMLVYICAEEVAPYGGKVLRTSLTKDKETELQEILTNRGLKTS